MSAAVIPQARRSIVDECFMRQFALTAFSVVLLAIAAAMLAAGIVDDRTIDGVNVWAKPTKFAFSIAIFAATNAWFFGDIQREFRRTRMMCAVVVALIAAGSFELCYISWQAAHGLASHFNRSSPVYEIMYGLMGVGALVLTGTTLPIAWSIARHPAAGRNNHQVSAVVIGLVLCFILGAGIGGTLAQGTTHAVGAVGGHVPIFGWNRSGGDLRIAHFLGIHAQQAIPVLGALLALAPPKVRMPGLVLGSALYAGVTLLVFVQAYAGIPLFAR